MSDFRVTVEFCFDDAPASVVETFGLAVLDALLELDAARDPDLVGSLAKREIEIEFGVKAPDLASAQVLAAQLLQTALGATAFGTATLVAGQQIGISRNHDREVVSV